MLAKEMACSSPGDMADIRAWLDARRTTDPKVEERVRAILDKVARRGDKALVEYTREFDCPDFAPENLRVPRSAIEAAMSEVPGEDLDILREAAANIRAFHERQLHNSWWAPSDDGTVLGQLVRPVDRAGLYVPGGTGGDTPLVSSILMNAVPALVAGVRGIAMISPPRRDGTLNPYLLAAAGLLGLTEIYAVGSAWGVAALACGTETIAAVDVITGPGNIYVTTAKRMLLGRVGIDMIAGPSEIAILADESADPALVAADLLSQAEHDPLAASVLVTTSAEVAEQTKNQLAGQLESLPRGEIAAKSLAAWGGIFTVPDIDRGLELINTLAPEHLELMVRDPFELVGRVRHAGAIFLGASTPEPFGDYFAGPNHILPTMGTTRFSSALSVDHFMKKSSVIAASPKRMRRDADKIARLARLEGLEAHARSALARK